jgi:hypothetical protein
VPTSLHCSTPISILNACRSVEEQVQQVLEVVQPSPVPEAVKAFTVEERAWAQRKVLTALDTWSKRHGSGAGRVAMPRKGEGAAGSADR